MASETVQRFDQHAILELMGHKKLAGRVTEEVIGGAAMLRIDVPETAERPAYTKYFGTQAVYCITPCEEALAQRAAEQIERHNDPIPVYIPETRQLASGSITPAVVVVDTYEGIRDDEDDFDEDDSDDDSDPRLDAAVRDADFVADQAFDADRERRAL